MSSNREDACCIHDLIEAQAARTPEAEALAFGAAGLTFRELLERSGRVAAALGSLGVGPDTLVGLAVERSLDMICGALGILRAGGAYVPLDPGYPAERLAWIWEDARRGNLPGRPGVLLTQRALAGLLPSDGALFLALFLEDLQDAVDLPVPAVPITRILPENTAYVIYTSGSTGRPKGVVVPHGGVVNVVREAIRLMDVRPGDRVLQLASLGFDASVLEIFTALVRGACLVLTPRETLLSGEALGRELREQAVTTMVLPPSLLDMLPAGMEDELSRLRSILVGGEACSAATAARWSTGGRRMINAYAPTEATVFATASFCSGHGIPTLGDPIENLSVHLMDQDGGTVTGEGDGEICLGGAGVVRGYLNRPELTAERFIPDPFSVDPGARLYRSGDLARRLPDGDLLFLGRVDFQVKIRGVRIELGEIEAVLGEHDGVQTAVVVAREDGSAKRLVAYVVRRDSDLTVTALRAFLAERLPEAMVPAAFLFLESMPMTPTGKVDRRALPAPGSSRPELDTVWTAPRGATEEALARIWGELLGIDGIGALDSLFELGGHSLLAAQIVTRVREEMGVDLPLPAVFEHPTVVALAARLDRLREEGGSADEELPPLEPASHDWPMGPIPLSFTQERVWFLNQLSPGNYAYNFQFTVRFRGPLRPAVLEAALSEIVRRHEVLRTTFPAVDGAPVQVIHEPWPASVPVVDLRTVPVAEREAVALRIVQADIRRPFDLERLPLLRWLLLRLDEDDHLLLHVEHHFVHDGWSLAVFLREMKELYTAIHEGRPSPLPEPPVQYRDFVLWQRRWLQGDALARQLAWWKERLAGSPPVLELAADRPRSRTHSFLGGALRADLPRDLYAGVRAASRREGVTLFMTSLSAFQALLYRYTGQEDILLGSGIANRRLRELEEMIGMVVNTVVLRTAVEGGLTFRELAARARSTMLEAQAHQDLPFEKLVEELQPDRELSRNPLFQVLFSFHDSPVPDLDFAGLTGELYERHNGSAKSDLNVVAKPRAEQRLGFGSEDASDDMTFIWEYSGDLFEAATIDRMWSHYQALLAAFVEDPGRRISELPLLTAAERRQLAVWGDGPAGDKVGVPVNFQVAAWAERTPDALALAGNGVELSYAGLMEEAHGLAGRLTAIGVGPETVVAVLTERSPEAVVAALGVMEAGGAWLPLDPSYPAERLRFLLEDSGARAVVVRPEYRELVAEMGVAVVELALTPRPPLPARPSPPARERGRLAEDGLAYVIYTSGSTGRPKGVAVVHGGLANLADWHVRAYGVTPADRATMLAGPAFDASVWEVWPYLAAGASVHVPDVETRSDPRRLLAWMASERITLAFLPTPLAEALVETVESEAPAGLALRALLTGGDRLRRAPVRPLPFALVNHYGPTESTVVTTAGLVEPGRVGAPSIGRPIGGLLVRLLDRDGRRVPPGVPGELCVGGVGLARGYLGRPDLTAERFVPDADGDRLYRTGDLARWRSGELEFLGRIDHQVKIRGFRIELGEIEAVLAGCPGVREAVVTVRERDGDPVLVAYVVGEGSFESFLSERLPAYMVPSAFVVLPALPLTPNGKVDLRALPAPAWGEGEESGSPRTPLEETLAGIWGTVLGVEVGVHDNFFKLGGHSLIATRLLSRVRDAAGVEVPLSALFEAPTVAGLARVVEESMRGGSSEAGSIPRRDEAGPAPLSFAQERLWFLDQLTPGLSAYHIARAFRLRGPLDVDALARAVAGVVRRHEVLRTTFTGIAGMEGQPAQVILPPESLAVPFLEVNGEAEAERLLREETRKPFDLQAGPLLRLTVLRLGPGEHRLLLTMHHIVSDGWSMGIFFRELSALYRGEDLPDLPIQYADYAAWQRERLSGVRLAALLAHWKTELAGAPALLDLPADRPRPAVQSWRGSQVETGLPPEVAAGLREQARRSGATLFMTLLAGLGALCARYTGSSDVVLGSPVAGRNHSETEGLVGLFVNNLVLRLRWQGDPAFGEIAGLARRATLTAHAHQDLPFEKLVAELAPERSLGHTPFFQVVLSTQSRAAEALDLPGIAAGTLPVDRGESRFDLELAVLEGAADEGLRILWRYDRDLFDAATAERMAGHFTTLLGAAAADPGRRLSDLPLLAAEESAQLLAWNAGAEVFRPAGTLHGLFAARVARNPEAVAVVCEGAGLTYGELEAGADRLARFLVGLGVRPGDLVGLCLERSLGLVTAVLGVLKAGAAYLPLDPSHPKERLAFALEDSRVAVVLTQEAFGGVLAAPGVRLVRLDSDREEIGQASGAGLPAVVTPDFPAYVIYTSGSTGRPKGVIVTHANVVRLMAATDGWFGFGPDDVWTLFHSYAFDFSVWELWGALLYGGRLVVVPYWVSRSPEAFLELLVRERVTVLNQTPSAFRQLVWAEETVPDTPGLALRYVVFGGEALELASLAPWYERHPEDAPRLVNMYGITETTVHVTYRPLSRRDVEEARGSVIGRAIPDLSLRVLDADLRPQPVGVPGELHVGGPGLAAGYLGRPELTAARFVPDPFGPAGARLYRSGDLARYLPDGDLEYLGRIDHQVKIRGFRIELGEIETALASQPGVREAVVLAREDSPGEKRLVAYLVAESPVDADELLDRLVTALAALLPEYMIPAAFVTLPALPLTGNGKVDRRALPPPESAQRGERADYAPPESPEQERLARIWSEVLGVERVGIHDDFFRLGGHSLLATRVMAQVRRAFEVDLPLRSLFQAPTVDGLSRAVREAGAVRGPRIQAASRAAHRRVRPADQGGPV